ncbi:MAG: NUDIX domain-containing protein [Ghiorsea sp.]
MDVVDQVISLVAVCNQEDEVLLLKRPSGVHCPDVWSFPGGKVEASEMPLQAAVRELNEETHIKGKSWRHIGKHSHQYPDRMLHFLFFFCRYNTPNKLQCESDFAWFKLNQLQALAMPEANQPLIHMLQDCQQQGLFPPS